MSSYESFDAYRREQQHLSHDVSLAFYEHGAGIRKEFDLRQFFDARPEHFSEETARQVKAAYEQATGDEKRQLRRLWGVVLGNISEYQHLDLVEEYFRKEAAATVTLDGKEVNYRYSSVLLVNESDRDRRRGIYDAATPVFTKSLNPLKLAMTRANDSFAKEHGFSGYEEYFCFFNETDYPAFAEVTRDYLDRTEGLYMACLNELSESLLGVKPSELEGHDVGFLRRGNAFDEHFPAERLLPALHETLKGLGITEGVRETLNDAGNIYLDLETREGKMPRAFCIPIDTPGDVRVVHLPQGGLGDYHTTFHEMGHALHFGNSAETLPVEYKETGDRGLAEGWAFFFQSLCYDKAWLKQFLGIDETETAFHRFNLFTKLMLHRVLSARCLYEKELRRNLDTLDGMPERFVDIHKHFLSVTLDPSRYIQVDEGYYTSDYLRAWFFEAQMRTIIKERFGDAWWNNPKAGEFLREVWKHGWELGVDQILERYFDTTFDTSFLIREFEEGLG